MSLQKIQNSVLRVCEVDLDKWTQPAKLGLSPYSLDIVKDVDLSKAHNFLPAFTKIMEFYAEMPPNYTFQANIVSDKQLWCIESEFGLGEPIKINVFDAFTEEHIKLCDLPTDTEKFKFLEKYKAETIIVILIRVNANGLISLLCLIKYSPSVIIINLTSEFEVVNVLLGEDVNAFVLGENVTVFPKFANATSIQNTIVEEVMVSLTNRFCEELPDVDAFQIGSCNSFGKLIVVLIEQIDKTTLPGLEISSKQWFVGIDSRNNFNIIELTDCACSGVFMFRSDGKLFTTFEDENKFYQLVE